MAKKVAINGFGRIGRLVFRDLLTNPDVEVVAINDLTANATLAHLLKYDSAQGPFNGTVTSTDESLIVNGKAIQASAERDPSKLPWAELGVDVVLECTGIFRTAEKAGLHLQAGAGKVLISAPGKGGDILTIVMGVNDDDLTDDAKILSNASCTTNCLAPVVKILNDNWGIKVGSMTTTHAYTTDQNLQDGPHSDLRRARAAAYNILPTSTGAASAVGKVIPDSAGKLSAIAVRVPVVTASMIELNVLVDKPVTAEAINAAFKVAAEGPMKGLLQYQEDPIVSADVIRNRHSSVFDSLMTEVIQGNFVKVVSWYDNEAGYAARLADLLERV
jgi:glyceraldehyde 3-phosphate dehydrogenase